MLLLNKKYLPFSKSTTEGITLLYDVSHIFWKYVDITKCFLLSNCYEKIQEVQTFPTVTAIK